MNLTLKIWRQANATAAGAMHTYTLDGVSSDMSFLEMLDLLNEQLLHSGEEPIAFDSDCREGICGMCSLMINGQAHGPEVTTTCQLHMRPSRTATRSPSSRGVPTRSRSSRTDRRPLRVRPDHLQRRLHLGQHRLGPGGQLGAGSA